MEQEAVPAGVDCKRCPCETGERGKGPRWMSRAAWETAEQGKRVEHGRSAMGADWWGGAQEMEEEWKY